MAVNNMQNQAQLISRLYQYATKCFGVQSSATLFTNLFVAKLMTQPNVYERANVEITDDKMVITIEVPINKADLVGESGWDYIPSPSFTNLVSFISLKYKVSSEDPIVRLIGALMGILLKKFNEHAELEGITEEDMKMVKECFKWIDKDVKEILKLIETLAMRNNCGRKRCKLLLRGDDDAEE